MLHDGVYTAEAEYAYNLKKDIVALRMQNNYMPTGWLGPLGINNLFYEFSDPENYDWDSLKQRLKALLCTSKDIETRDDIRTQTANTGKVGYQESNAFDKYMAIGA